MPARKPGKTSTPTARTPAQRTAAPGQAASALPETMRTGKASPAKAAEGDQPVFDYIATSRSRSEVLPHGSMPWRPGRCPTCSAP